jgi:hypothetical protein
MGVNPVKSLGTLSGVSRDRAVSKRSLDVIAIRLL